MRQVGWRSRGHAARLFRQYVGPQSVPETPHQHTETAPEPDLTMHAPDFGIIPQSSPHEFPMIR